MHEQGPAFPEMAWRMEFWAQPPQTGNSKSIVARGKKAVKGNAALKFFKTRTICLMQGVCVLVFCSGALAAPRESKGCFGRSKKFLLELGCFAAKTGKCTLGEKEKKTMNRLQKNEIWQNAQKQAEKYGDI